MRSTGSWRRRQRRSTASSLIGRSAHGSSRPRAAPLSHRSLGGYGQGRVPPGRCSSDGAPGPDRRGVRRGPGRRLLTALRPPFGRFLAFRRARRRAPVTSHRSPVRARTSSRDRSAPGPPRHGRRRHPGHEPRAHALRPCRHPPAPSPGTRPRHLSEPRLGRRHRSPVASRRSRRSRGSSPTEWCMTTTTATSI
jgi:hypothetical protein